MPKLPPDDAHRSHCSRPDPPPGESTSGGEKIADDADALRESFVALLTAEQLNLQRYIVTLLGNFDAASNVLQETNLVLWRKLEEFELGTSFSAWARKVAYWQTLAYLRDRKRDKHVFSEKLVLQLAARSAMDEDASETRIALRHCLSGLKANHLNLIKERYGGNLSIDAVAEKLGEQPGAVKVRLHRIRRTLQNCIEKKMMASQ